MRFAGRIAGIDISGIRKMFDLGNAEGVINLALGEPDFPIPPESKDAIRKALEEDFTHYTPGKGIRELRMAIARREEEKGVRIGDKDIMVTSGASEALHLALMAMIENGDEVLIPDPGFVSYKPLVELAGGRAVSYLLSEDRDFDIDIEDFKERITRKTRMIIVNSPGNPTGGVLSRESLKVIADTAEDSSILLLSDEVYDDIVYDSPHVSPQIFTENTIIVKGFSKSYAMTGLRLGYALARQEIIESMLKVHQYIQASTCSLSQRAALAALSSKSYIEEMVDQLKKRRGLVLKELRKVSEVTCALPKGAFYVFPNFSRYGSSQALAMKLLQEARVVVTPGTAFGKGGEGFIRISFAAGKDKIKEGINRMRRCLHETT
jgi:aspartate aminotransferase